MPVHHTTATVTCHYSFSCLPAFALRRSVAGADAQRLAPPEARSAHRRYAVTPRLQCGSQEPVTGGQLAARPARVDGGRGGDKPPHKNRRPKADLLTGRACPARRGRAGRGGFSCLAALSPGPQNDAAPDDNAGPGRGAEAGEGGNEQGAQRLRAAADRCSRAGIKPFKRRPQADSPLQRPFTW